MLRLVLCLPFRPCGGFICLAYCLEMPQAAPAACFRHSTTSFLLVNIYCNCSHSLSQLPLFPQSLHEENKGLNLRQCIVCSRKLPFSCFPNHCHNKDGLDRRCRSCIKQQSKIRSILKSRFPRPAPGHCPICQKYTSRWVLDHCHHSGTFRGYICDRCNLGLGKFYDDPQILAAALKYLKVDFLDEK